jgi:7-carboxy-7-deazaguanine synthase
MRIAEIFYSIQGEGELTGVPSVFVRTSGCNLRCRWCDTPFASWNPEGDTLSVDTVFTQVTAFSGVRHAVFTGGEPMLVRELADLGKKLRDAGWHITIETAGTIAPGDAVYDLASISPKLANSAPTQADAGSAWVERHHQTRLQPEILRAWLLAGDYQLKFVVGQASEIGEIKDLLAQTRVPVPAHKVLLMPEGIESSALREKSLAVAEWCKETGFRFCDRLHVHLYGHTRGT